MQLATPLDVQTTISGREALIEVAGELDIDTAPVLRMAISECMHKPLDDLAIDVRGVSFCDCSGLNALIHARTWARDAGVRFRLLHPRRQLANLLTATGTAQLFRTPDEPPAEGAVLPPRMSRDQEVRTFP